ncbi:MAG TPA: MBL fold metallo-hydrolase [Acidimicrobiales bacterium]
MPAAERSDIARYAAADAVFERRQVDATGVEVIPTPGHSPGSTSFLVPGVDGDYLFTGDAVYRGADGRWAAGFLRGTSDPVALAASLDVLAALRPALMASSAFAGGAGAHAMTPAAWAAAVAQARVTLPASA